MKRSATPKPNAPGALLAATLAAAAALLGSGCGGSTTAKAPIIPTRDASPTVYGLQAQAVLIRGQFLEASGLAGPDGLTPYITAGVDYVGTPIATQAGEDGKIPLGHAPGARWVGETPAQAAPAGGSVLFGAYIANGTDAASGAAVPIDPNGVTLTTRRSDGTEEIPGFSVPLTFVLSTEGPLASATYRTASFTLPFATTGLHSLAVTVTDERGAASAMGASTTFFDVAVLQPEHAAVVVQVLDADGNPVPGATASITNPVADARAQTTADAQGVVVLFAAPGAQTITVTGEDLDYTAEVTLTAGQALVSDADGNPLSIAPPEE